MSHAALLIAALRAWIALLVLSSSMSASATTQAVQSEPAQNRTRSLLATVFEVDHALAEHAALSVTGGAESGPNGLLLKPGAGLQVQVAEASPWVELDLSLQFPVEAAFRCELAIALANALDTSIVLERKRAKDGDSWIDSVTFRESQLLFPVTVREHSGQEFFEDGRWRFVYRVGHLICRSPGGTAWESAVKRATPGLGEAACERITTRSTLGHVTLGAVTLRAAPAGDDRNRAREQLLDLESTRIEGLLRNSRYAEVRAAMEAIEPQLSELAGRRHATIRDARLASRTFSRSADAYTALGKYDRAMELVSAAVEIDEQVLGPAHPQLGTLLSDFARLSQDHGDYSRAATLLQRCLTITATVLGPRHKNYATDTYNLATVYEDMGEFDRAESYYLKTIDLEEEVLGEDDPSFAMTIEALGLLYKETGEYVQAERLLRRANVIFRKAGGPRNKRFASNLNNLALLYQSMGDYARAEPLYQQALEIKKELYGTDHPSYGVAVHNLAFLFEEMGEFDRALPLSQESLRVARDVYGDKHPSYAASANNLALVFIGMSEFARAEPLIVEAKNIWRATAGELDNRYATAVGNLGWLYANMGADARAEPLYREAVRLKLATLGDQHPAYAESLQTLALLYWRRGDDHRARELNDQAVTIVRGVLDRNSVVQSERQQKQNQTKHRHYLNVQVGFASDDPPAIERALISLWRWKGAVTFRQRAFREFGTDPALVPRFAELQAITRRLSSLTGRAPMAPRPGASEIDRQQYEQARRRWGEELRTITQRREDLEQEIAAGSAEFQRLLTTLTPEAIARTLPAGAAFVDFFDYRHPLRSEPTETGPSKPTTFERRYVAFVVRSDSRPRLVSLGRASAIELSIAAFRRAFDPGSAASRRLQDPARAREDLRSSLWAPLEQHLEGVETVILSPDTSLGTLPFAALPGRAKGSYLLEDYRLVSVSLARLLPELARPPASPRQRGLLVVGDVSYDGQTESSGRADSRRELLAAVSQQQGQLLRADTDGRVKWESLPGFQAEMSSVRELYRQSFGAEASVETLSGSEASEPAFLQVAPEFGTLHLITHGFFSRPTVTAIGQASMQAKEIGRSPGADPFFGTWMPGLLSGLVMAGANRPPADPEDLNDGILRASEIEATPMQGVDLVVLSACETGLGAVAGGEGLTGLQRAFHIAGVRSVVASLWKVDDLATQELMKQFYTNLWIRKQSKIDALRNAQLWMLNNASTLTDLGVKGVRERGDVLRRNTAARPAASSDGRTSPFFWAAFTLSGDWR